MHWVSIWDLVRSPPEWDTKYWIGFPLYKILRILRWSFGSSFPFIAVVCRGVVALLFFLRILGTTFGMFLLYDHVLGDVLLRWCFETRVLFYILLVTRDRDVQFAL